MAETKIEWTSTTAPDGTKKPGYSFNPWIGCMKVNDDCKFCYAETFATNRMGRFGKLWGPEKSSERHRTSSGYWQKALSWNEQAKKDGVRRKVFCASMADIFEDNTTIVEWRKELWELIWKTPFLDWLMLTKRPYNIAAMLPPDWGEGYPNVWLGTSIGHGDRWDMAVPLLMVPAAIHFISYEPATADLDLKWTVEPALGTQSRVTGQNTIDWVICGGESGPGARPFNIEWARNMKKQCHDNGVAFFMKQMGAVWAKENHAKDKKGGDMEEWPEDLRVREYPNEFPETISISNPISTAVIARRFGRMFPNAKFNDKED